MAVVRLAYDRATKKTYVCDSNRREEFTEWWLTDGWRTEHEDADEIIIAYEPRILRQKDAEKVLAELVKQKYGRRKK